MQFDPSPDTASVHLEGASQNLSQPFRAEMPACPHHVDDPGELLKICPLGGAQLILAKERHHLRHQVGAVSYHQDVGFVAGVSVIRLEISTSENAANQLEYMLITVVLRDMELRNHLPLPSRARISLNRDMEASFTVDEPSGVVADRFVWPSLLIACTHHIVTSVANVCTTLVVWDPPGFPAYSRIYRQQRSLTVSRRSEPSSRTALMGEQPNPWEVLPPQDATSRHRGAKLCRRCGLLGRISLLSPGYLLSVDRPRFHTPRPGH